MIKTSLKEKILNYIKENPFHEYKQIAEGCNTSLHMVTLNIKRLRGEGYSIPLRDENWRKEKRRFEENFGKDAKNVKEKKEDATSFKQNGDEAEYVFKSKKRITTIDDLIENCNIDLEKWDIVEIVCNKWEVGRKNKNLNLDVKDGAMTGSIIDSGDIFVEPLFQIKVKLKPKNGANWSEFRQSLIDDIKSYSPIFPVIKRVNIIKDPVLYLVDPSDPHFGKYASIEETGERFDLEEATKRYNEGIDGLIDKASSYNIERIVMIGGNDVNHIDNPFNKTTKGTHQDTSSMWFENFNASKIANIKAIEKLLTVANVHFVHCQSNHDVMTGFFLAQTIQAWFHNCNQITFDISPAHRKYIQYGNNLIGCTHGDGAPETALPDLMKTEAKKAWSVSEYAYWYVHHIHHKDKKAIQNAKPIRVEQDGRGVSVLKTGLSLEARDYSHVEYLRSMTGTDSWHHQKGFQHAFKAMEGFIHHPEYGQINRISHLF